jgi:hypothetical protein
MSEIVPIIDTDLDYDPDSTLEEYEEGYDTESTLHTTQTEGSSEEESGNDTIIVISSSGNPSSSPTSVPMEDTRYVIMGDVFICNISVLPEDIGARVITVGNTIGSLFPICPKTTSRLKRHYVNATLAMVCPRSISLLRVQDTMRHCANSTTDASSMSQL